MTEPLRALVVGRGRNALAPLISAVAREIGREVAWGSQEDALDLVFAVVTPCDATDILREAYDRGRGGPVIALLPTSDETLAKQSLACGARAWYALDTPPQLLRFVMLTLA